MMDQLATFFIVIREGAEALLLLMLFNQATNTMEQRRWMISGALGGIAVPLMFVSIASGYAEAHEKQIEMATNLIAGFILLYVFFWSRSILEHVHEHAARMKSGYYNASIWGGPLVMISSWFIVARESTELSLMVWNSYVGDPAGTMKSLIAGAIVLTFLAFGFEKIAKKINIGTFFRISGWIFLIMGLHYLWEGAEKAIDLWPQILLYLP